MIFDDNSADIGMDNYYGVLALKYHLTIQRKVLGFAVDAIL